MGENVGERRRLLGFSPEIHQCLIDGTGETMVKSYGELQVGETVKLCIELDEEMLEQWNWTKNDFSETLEYVHNKTLVSTDKVLFKCLLFCYEKGFIDALPISFAASLSEEETEAMELR